MKSTSGILVILAGMLLFQGVRANEWNVDAETSRIGFVATYDEIPFEGRFDEFTALIRFDPENPSDGSFLITIGVASVNTDSPDRDEGMLEADWFDVESHPEATFTSLRFERLSGENEYAVTGDLTIKGITNPVTATFSWTPADSSVRLKGSADVERGDFDIGTGDWKDDDTIGFDVRIVFDLTLTQ